MDKKVTKVILEDKSSKPAEEKVSLKGWLSLTMLIILFSGVFAKSEGPLKALDLGNLVGSFGSIFDGINFKGVGGSGASEGFIFALTLIPTTCLAVGLVEVAENMGAMGAANKLFTPILRPILGIPGTAGIPFVASFTSSDIASFMTKELYEDGMITDDERTIFISYQYAGSAVILNTISTQAPLLPIVVLSVGPIILFLWIFKVLGANLVRFVISRNAKNQLKEAK